MTIMQVQDQTKGRRYKSFHTHLFCKFKQDYIFICLVAHSSFPTSSLSLKLCPPASFSKLALVAELNPYKNESLKILLFEML